MVAERCGTSRHGSSRLQATLVVDQLRQHFRTVGYYIWLGAIAAMFIHHAISTPARHPELLVSERHFRGSRFETTLFVRESRHAVAYAYCDDSPDQCSHNQIQADQFRRVLGVSPPYSS